MHPLTSSQFPLDIKTRSFFLCNSQILFFEIVICLYNDINPLYMHTVGNNHTNTMQMQF